MSRRPTDELTTERLVLTPLRVDDAHEMVGVLSDAAMYTFTGGAPPAIEDLQTLYRSQVAGPRSGDEVWHNWVIRLAGSGGAIGLVQATASEGSADVAWMVAPAWQRRGFATEAATAMCTWLKQDGVESFTAHIHPDHVASNRVAASIGLQRTDEVDDEGEVVWTSA